MSQHGYFKAFSNYKKSNYINNILFLEIIYFIYPNFPP